MFYVYLYFVYTVKCLSPYEKKKINYYLRAHILTDSAKEGRPAGVIWKSPHPCQKLIIYIENKILLTPSYKLSF